MKKLSAAWSLLQGVTLWAIWIERNELDFNDETLPIKNKPKHPKKAGIQGTKWKDPPTRRQKNHLRGQTTRVTSSSWTTSCHEMALDGMTKSWEGLCEKDWWIVVEFSGSRCCSKSRSIQKMRRNLEALTEFVASIMLLVHVMAKKWGGAITPSHDKFRYCCGFGCLGVGSPLWLPWSFLVWVPPCNQ